MRKRIMTLLLCISAAFLFSGCHRDNRDDCMHYPDTCPPVDGTLSCFTDEAINQSFNEDEIRGTITSPTTLSTMPTENDQANVFYQDAPYTSFDDGLTVYMNEQWICFETRNNT